MVIINAYSQKSDQGPSWGGGAVETKSQFTFAISFDMIIFNELKVNSRIIKMMWPTVLRIFSLKSK